jgi:hypothetical protein
MATVIASIIGQLVVFWGQEHLRPLLTRDLQSTLHDKN